MIPSASQYIPRSQRPEVQANQSKAVHNVQNELPKVILQKFLLENGNVTFAVGTKVGNVVNRDSREVLLQEILDHVTPAELQRFETQEFLEEDEREEQERLLKLLRKKAPGRPRKYPLPSSRPPLPSTPGLINGKRPRGRPRKNTVSAPSFNGPQPTLEVTRPTSTVLDRSSVISDSESSSEVESTPRRPQYSMVAASGLAPPETSEEETSREVSMSRTQTPDLQPSPKRRKVDSSALRYPAPTSTPIVRIPLDVSPTPISQPKQTPAKSSVVDLTQDDTDVEEVETIKPQPRSNVGLYNSTPTPGIDEEREALLRQFQSHDNRRSSPASSSSDSLMSRTITVERAEKLPPLSAQPTQKPLTPTRNPTPVNERLGLTKDSSPPNISGGDSTSPLQRTPPSTTKSRRVSLAPHSPHEKSFSQSSYSSTDIRPVSSASTSTKKPTQPIIPMSSPSKRKHSPAPTESRNPKSKPFKTTQSSPLKPLQPTNDITAYFRPKYTPTKPPQPGEPDSDDEEEESENSIVHDSSPDSLSPQILQVQRDSPTPRQATRGGQHDPNKQLTGTRPPPEQDVDDDNDESINLISKNVPHAQTTPERRTMDDIEMMGQQHKLRGDLGDDEDSTYEDSESDSLSSEVLVVRGR